MIPVLVHLMEEVDKPPVTIHIVEQQSAILYHFPEESFVMVIFVNMAISFKFHAF